MNTLKRRIEKLEEKLFGPKGKDWIFTVNYWDDDAIKPHYSIYRGVKGDLKNSQFVRNLTNEEAAARALS